MDNQHKPLPADTDWRAKLTPEQYRVLRQAGTEPAWTGELLGNKADGDYICAGCGAPVFRSDDMGQSCPISQPRLPAHL